MRLLTWNLNGLDDLMLDERTEAAVFIAVTGFTLRQLTSGKRPWPAPDVLVFQEVTPRTYTAHLAVHLPRGGYTLFPPEPPEREIFEVIAVRQPAHIASAESTPLDRSLYGRCLNVVEVDGVPSLAGPIRVLTAHLDSGVEEGAVRIAESRQALRAMNARSIFAGDTNLRDVEWDQLNETGASEGVADAWVSVGSPPDLRRTWRMAGRGARFDRIWLGSGLQAVDMSAAGAATLAGIGASPSDHIGLIVEVREASPTS